ncbi:MAG: hypothetical protein COZ31_08535 [Nitrospirae bacterium CG_4_10_14_3_um_filter_44_29]|nr:hypothetical protein [Nitrospirota bacterium]OIO29041.1 MAG: hypothetical protein AUJ60_06060 [Nitrospirae bacterium CG1_02_44_142]PIP69663.1 MAG: hypothetical protein COW90_09410 [Nitrospirae bacterium CG22_combo_CG10-13_8_21_14_all_44_11]PIV40111.1 MAG: hypothetical protein COS28_10605 [Nitrospirae bacterium CG02_land_8_20_14_3_00_44_33]PIV67562.1 MAG: hypothetical protein COS10_00410 [Nitrospirae bacterium CG01_land_8_20_14_3_00_44_22]PIW90642.1 MAG: hypothetical protein COZ93_00895 [Nit
MPKIHYFQRYSSVENTVTNNTLQLFARIYNYSTSQASKVLSELSGEPVEIGIEINQQERAKDSVPDGTIIQRSFKVLVEAKVDAGVDTDQLIRHAANFSNESQKILLLLTKQPIEKKEEENISRQILAAHPGVVFKNITYEGVCKAIRGLFKDYEYEMYALVDDYVEYCNDANLFDQSKFLMRILPCGESVEINKKYGIYFHPSDRGYTNHSFVGIYANKTVQSIWAIDSVFDIEFDGTKLKKKLIQGRATNDYDEKIIGIIKDAKKECGYNVEDGHRFFCGSPAETDYKKSSAGGIQGARFINLRDVIGEFTDTKDVAKKLTGKLWE